MKYKLWDINNNCWYERGDIYLDEDGQLFCIEELGGYTPYMNKENVSARYEMVRWTGITDRNGKEIYEGDVLKDEEDIVKVDFENGQFIAMYRSMSGKWLSYGSLSKYMTDHDGEVIGNVFENGDLLNDC